MRENDTILLADMCHNDTAVREDVKYMYVPTDNSTLPDDAGIKVSKSGKTFKASIAS